MPALKKGLNEKRYLLKDHSKLKLIISPSR